MTTQNTTKALKALAAIADDLHHEWSCAFVNFGRSHAVTQNAWLAYNSAKIAYATAAQVAADAALVAANAAYCAADAARRAAIVAAAAAAAAVADAYRGTVAAAKQK